MFGKPPFIHHKVGADVCGVVIGMIDDSGGLPIDNDFAGLAAAFQSSFSFVVVGVEVFFCHNGRWIF